MKCVLLSTINETTRIKSPLQKNKHFFLCCVTLQFFNKIKCDLCIWSLINLSMHFIRVGFASKLNCSQMLKACICNKVYFEHIFGYVIGLLAHAAELCCCSSLTISIFKQEVFVFWHTLSVLLHDHQNFYNCKCLTLIHLKIHKFPKNHDY